MELVGLLVSQLIMIVIISVFTRACVSNKMSARYIWFEAGREFQAWFAPLTRSEVSINVRYSTSTLRTSIKTTGMDLLIA